MSSIQEVVQQELPCSCMRQATVNMTMNADTTRTAYQPQCSDCIMHVSQSRGYLEEVCQVCATCYCKQKHHIKMAASSTRLLCWAYLHFSTCTAVAAAGQPHTGASHNLNKPLCSTPRSFKTANGCIKLPHILSLLCTWRK